MAATAVASILLVLFAVASAATTTPAHAPVDIRLGAKEVVSTIRNIAMRAKDGISMDLLLQDVLDLQIAATELLSQLPGEASQCETQAIIKMAAAGTGSHEVLTLLLAEDTLSILSGRLALSLAVMEEVAQQLEDELSLSSEVGPHLAAAIFSTNATTSIINRADKTVKQVASHSAANDNRVRRQLRSSFDLGRGWSVGLGGVNWESTNGRYSFNARPTFNGFKPDGFRAGFTIRF